MSAYGDELCVNTQTWGNTQLGAVYGVFPNGDTQAIWLNEIPTDANLETIGWKYGIAITTNLFPVKPGPYKATFEASGYIESWVEFFDSDKIHLVNKNQKVEAFEGSAYSNIIEVEDIREAPDGAAYLMYTLVPKEPNQLGTLGKVLTSFSQ